MTALTAGGQTLPADSTVTLSLDRCIEIALEENPTVKVADMEVRRVDYSRKETLGQLLPSVSFGATYNRMLAKQVAYMNMDRFSPSGGGDSDSGETPQSRAGSRDTGIKMGLDNSFSVGFSAGIPLIAPQLWKSLKISDAQILTALEDARSSRLSLVNSVQNAYYTLLLALDSQKTMQQSLDMARFTADLYAKKHSLGAASQYDVLRTEVAVRNIEPEVAQAEISVKQARLQLSILMGLDAAIKIQPDVTLASYEKTMYADALESASSRDLSGNTSLRQLDLQTNTLSRTLEMQKAAWWPTLSLSANYNWTSSSDGSPFKGFRWNPYSIIGLTLNIPIYQGGQRWNRIRQTETQLNEMSLRRADLTRQVDMQVDLSIDNINTNVKQIASCSESVRQAETAHSIARQSFEIGAASYLDLRDAELALTRSRLSFYQAIYNYLIARSNLQLLLGNYPLPASVTTSK